MKRFSIIILLLIALLASCTPDGPKANVNDLQLVSGIRDRKLMLEGSEGATATFSFRANHDWQLLDYKGFTCTPSSGRKSEEGEVITVTATTLQSNNSDDTIRLSDLNFKLLSTRFVGISAYQLPQIRLPKGNKVNVDALSGSTGSITIVSSNDDIALVVEGNITAELGEKNDRNEYRITVKATTDNITPLEQVIGTIGFEVEGVRQGGKIEVLQTSAIVLDRSEVLLPGKAGGENIFVVDSDFDIAVSTTSSNFSITNLGNNTFSVVANSANTTGDTLPLGSIDISLVESSDCKCTIEVKQRKAKASQTIIVHFIGTALQHYFSHNVTKMLEALNKDIQGEAQVIVITTDASTNGTLYELRYDANLGKAVKEKVKELALPTPYDSALFENNLRKALEFAPAEKYALVVGSHGLGWIPKSSTSGLARHLSHLGLRPNEWWKRNENAEMTRHLGDSDGTRYDVEELAEAIVANKVKFDYILFDACFMGNVESVYALRNAANYIIGSPCEVMGYGFPYANIMKYMLAEGGTSYNLDKICSEYVHYYKTDASTPSASVAVTATAELEALAQAMKAVNAAGVKSDFSLDNVQYYEGQSPHSFYDLGHMVELSCADATAASAFKKQLDKTVTSRYHTERFYSAYGSNNVYYHDINYYTGITTSAMVDHYEYDWSQTEWYKATH